MDKRTYDEFSVEQSFYDFGIENYSESLKTRWQMSQCACADGGGSVSGVTSAGNPMGMTGGSSGNMSPVDPTTGLSKPLEQIKATQITPEQQQAISQPLSTQDQATIDRMTAEGRF